uniref:PPPDE domain-containing protein n=1 Tax=Noctiluca scintillans TaxID=2966 RepID=A0A7S1FA24_NOCSC
MPACRGADSYCRGPSRAPMKRPVTAFGSRCQSMMMQRAEVFLHVYDLGDGWLTANSVSSDLLNLGGAFHVGVEVHMTEFYFGSEGVATCLPKMADGHVYRETVSMGRTNLTVQQVEQLVMQMRWNGNDYDILRHNCVSFSNAFCQRLVGCGVPSWVKRFPQAVALAATGLDPVVDLSALVLLMTQGS